MTLWKNFWIVKKRDPRVPNLKKPCPPKLLQKQRDFEVLHSKEHVSNIWESVELDERDSILN
eukprot:CAMPEP_0184501106 /NCGR_PEP_ID=MMETSP0113_2-20130426/46713_1 /TAXON_ID=91329 /ORGANISM="Norrisiella sphaerica, Strain BC52" /LENGTH=61 /DNA_ID=CAMNT_0026889749 /DNA_START=170 /DNA_END=352 /DNA_ORIENTATION=-